MFVVHAMKKKSQCLSIDKYLIPALVPVPQEDYSNDVLE